MIDEKNRNSIVIITDEIVNVRKKEGDTHIYKKGTLGITVLKKISAIMEELFTKSLRFTGFLT